MRQQAVASFGLIVVALLGVARAAAMSDGSEQVVATVAESNANVIAKVPAMWRVQRIPFEFRGDTVSYTCESFTKKVRAALISVGVSPSLIVQARCAPSAQAPFLRAPDPGNPGREAEGVATSRAYRTTKLSTRISAMIALAAPAIASKENIDEATTFDAERKLVARVNREELPDASDIPIFSAVWVPISLMGDANTWLDASDCELLRQLSKQVLPRIGVEVISSKLICSASASSKPTVEVKALLPLVKSSAIEALPQSRP